MLNYLKAIPLLIYRNIKWLLIIITNNNGLTVRTPGGKIYLPLDKISPDIKESDLQKQLALDNIREVLATNEIKKVLSQGDNILEIGANIGYFVILEAKIIGKKGKIYALEPEKSNFQLLKKNVRLNHLEDRVKTERLAIGDKVRKEKLYTAVSCNLHTLECANKNNGADFQIIDTTTIDEYIKDKRIDYIRMDIEGWEYRAIKGMEKTLRKGRPLKMFIEIHPHIMGTGRTIKMLRKLKESGLKATKVISHDTYIRRLLNQSSAQKITINQLIKIIKSEKPHAYEVFFERG